MLLGETLKEVAGLVCSNLRNKTVNLRKQVRIYR
jgi:hypothetical protein